MEVIFAFAIWATIFGGGGTYIAKQKGREAVEGFIIGLFGPLGLLVVCLMPSRNIPTVHLTPVVPTPRQVEPAKKPFANEDLDLLRGVYITGLVIAVVILLVDAAQPSYSKGGYSGFALLFILWGGLILGSVTLALRKGREFVEGVILGAFGPLGFIIEVLLPPVNALVPVVQTESFIEPAHAVPDEHDATEERVDRPVRRREPRRVRQRILAARLRGGYTREK